MQSGLYVSLSSQMALEKRLNTIADNMANVNTTGFRATEVKFDEMVANTKNKLNTKVAFVSQGNDYLNEQNGDDLIKLFDQLDTLTREPFTAAKAKIDTKLAADCGVKGQDLMPWHYHDPFFQETPAVFPADIDEPFKTADLEAMTRLVREGHLAELAVPAGSTGGPKPATAAVS